MLGSLRWLVALGPLGETNVQTGSFKVKCKCFGIDSCSTINSSSTTRSKIMSRTYWTLLIGYALCKVLNTELLINSHICSVKSSHFTEENEISERVSNLHKTTKLVNCGA